ERCVIAASINGVPQHQVGYRTDVMDACPTAEGMMMMILSMSAAVLVVDEFGSYDDVEALLEAINAGVTIFCAIHGRSLEELKNRPTLQAEEHTSELQSRFDLVCRLLLEKKKKKKRRTKTK